MSGVNKVSSKSRRTVPRVAKTTWSLSRPLTEPLQLYGGKLRTSKVLPNENGLSLRILMKKSAGTEPHPHYVTVEVWVEVSHHHHHHHLQLHKMNL